VGEAKPVIAAANTSVSGIWSFLTAGSNWSGANGFPVRLAQHLGYSAEALAIATAIGLPLGLFCGHTGRGGGALSMASNAARALPTLGLLTLFAVAIRVGLTAAIIPLVLLAIPPILVNTYVGVRNVDQALVDAARGMGLRPSQVLFGVEVPVALPLVVLGLRNSALQVVSTATIAAEVGIGGLGRYIIDGYATNDYAELGAGAVMVAAFAITVEALFLLSQRLVVSPGLRARPTTI
jgi:osmoprotectant transport system permease protein